MPISVSKEQADACLAKLGIHCVAQDDGLSMYSGNPNDFPLIFDFKNGSIVWSDFCPELELAGIKPDTFLAFLDPK